MKKISIILIASIILLSCNKQGIVPTQNLKDSISVKEISKYDAFVSAKGSMFKFYSHKLPKIKTNYGEKIETSLREIIVGGETRFFYLVEKPDKYSTDKSLIAEDDMKEVLKAIVVLKEEALKDVEQDVYVENSFITDDYFKVTYFLSGKNNINWAIGVGIRGNKLIFINNTDDLEANLESALKKIEIIRQNKQLK